MEVEWAAACLIKLKHEKLDDEAAMELQNQIESTKRRMFFERNSVPPKPMFPPSFPLPRPQIKPKKIENAIEKKNENEDRIQNGSGVFKANPEFVLRLNRGETSLTKLPPVGQAIDGIDLPRLPPIESLKGKIGNCSVPFEKQLTKTDLDKGQARLVLSGESVKCLMKKLMKESEYEKMTDAKHEGQKVTVYDETGRSYEMKFKLWAEKTHVLTKGWNEFSSDNQLEPCLDWLTVWMFRHIESQKLCFAIVARRFPTENLIGKTQKNANKNKKQKRKE